MVPDPDSVARSGRWSTGSAAMAHATSHDQVVSVPGTGSRRPALGGPARGRASNSDCSLDASTYQKLFRV